MANDPTNPTTQVNTVTDAVNSLEAAFSGVLDDITKAFGADGQGILKTFTNTVDDLMSKVGGGLFDNISKFSGVVKDVSQNNIFDDSTRAVDGLIDVIGNLTVLVKQPDIFKNLDGSSTINKTTDSLTGLAEGLKSIGAGDLGKLFDDGAIKNIADAASAGEVLQNNYLHLLSSSGQLDDAFDKQGGTLKNLTALTGAYMTGVIAAKDATGLSLASTTAFANELNKIPGAMQQTIVTSEQGADAVSTLITSMRLMTGTQQSATTIIDQMNKANDLLGNSTGKVNDNMQKGAELISLSSIASKAFGLDFTVVAKSLDDTAIKFKDMGDNTEAATRVMGRYMDALKATGLTAKESLGIVDGLLENISKINTAQGALLSARAGGPGGLQGSLQIRELLDQGKSDQVIKMAENALKQQFGGHIYTQAEGAQSSEAAAGFARQRGILKSGAFGIGSDFDDAKAAKFLEALSKGNIGGASSQINSGKEALKEVANRGEQIQKDSNNYLKIANGLLEKTAVATDLTALGMTKLVFGNAGLQKAGLSGFMQDAANKSRGAQDDERKTRAGNVKQEGADDIIHKLRQNLAGNLLDIGGAVTEGVSGIKEKLKGMKSDADKYKDQLNLTSHISNSHPPNNMHASYNRAMQSNTDNHISPDNMHASYNRAMQSNTDNHMAALKSASEQAANKLHPNDHGGNTQKHEITLKISAPNHMKVEEKTQNLTPQMVLKIVHTANNLPGY